ncbi:chorismate mutase 1, chloroplastic-like [Vicia villosa]|uniref:chorismate mutase 1, chloroplastic-like n=1 Tax=Vicia villosa TaxID=3911 RepID=UPI00273B84CC|nr:chorismate mutase 1, chloroplastic-like [Vicia villosa]XP_058739335.1 chorismate mutase 1, chloroplastic-like [Vicia villosa]
MARAENEYTLDSVRQALVRQEDTIVFGLIERAKFPFNFHTYDKNYLQSPGFCGSLIEFVVQHSETVQAKAGRYENPEENPFFPENLWPSLVPSYPFTKVIHYNRYDFLIFTAHINFRIHSSTCLKRF